MATYIKFGDVDVSIDVAQPISAIGLGTVALFVSGSTPGAKSYASLSSLAVDFVSTTDTYKKAQQYFGMENPAKKIVVITYATAGENAISDAITNYWYEDWEFAVLVSYSAPTALALSNAIEARNAKFAVIQVPTVGGATPLAANKRTIKLVHPAAEFLDMALLGQFANLTVGSITWKFLGNLGLTAQSYTQAELDAIAGAYGIAYIKKAGKDQLTEGWSAEGNYIDTLHGVDWVKANMESRTQNALQNGSKIPYDDSGIAFLKSIMDEVLEIATAQGIVAKDPESDKGIFSTNAVPLADVDPAEKAIRNYPGLSFAYQASGAIHTVQIHGVLNA